MPKIVDVKCQLLKATFHDVSSGMKLIRSGDFYGLAIEESGDIIAMLNKRTCQQLLPLAEDQSVYLVAYLPKVEPPIDFHDLARNATFEVDVNIYGAFSGADRVGQILKGNDICLERPVKGISNVKYYNPHYLHLRHSAETDMNSENFGLPDPASGMTTTSDEGQLDSILNSLSHGSHLHEQHVDSRIKSVLLPSVMLSFPIKMILTHQDIL